MTEAHAWLAPSSADIWGAPDGCPAYPRMAAAYPEEDDTPESREGTAAHEYVARVLNGNAPTVGRIAENGHPFTDEMVECAEGLLADVETWRFSCIGAFVVEQRLHMPEIHPTLNWGTCDIGGADMTNRVLYVRDYKYGHRYVDAWENWQLIDYGVGLFRHFGIHESQWHLWTINAGIFQPRCYHPEGPRKIWICSGARFVELVDSLAYAARKATEPDAPMHTGEHCRDCSARYDCPALIQAGGASVDLSMRGVPQVLTPQKAGLVRRHITDAIQRLEALQSGLDAQIAAYIRSGKHVPGVDLVAGQGREYWTVPTDEVAALGTLYDKKLIKAPEPITPAQARKLGVDESVISAYSDRRNGELKVTAVDDNRAAKAFK